MNWRGCWTTYRHSRFKSWSTDSSTLNQWFKIWSVIQDLISDSRFDQWFKIWSVIKDLLSDSRFDQLFKIWSVTQDLISDSKFDQWVKIWSVNQDLNRLNSLNSVPRYLHVCLFMHTWVTEVLHLKLKKHKIAQKSKNNLFSFLNKTTNKVLLNS